MAERRRGDRHVGDLKRTDALAAVRTALNGFPPQAGAKRPVWETAYFRRWANVFARQHVDGLELSTEDRLIYQQVFNPAFRETWADFLEHRSRHPARGGPGLPLTARLAQVTGGDLPAHAVFHPAVDLRDEATVALLLADETPQDRAAVARYADALALARRTRPGFSTAAVRDDVTRRVLLGVWRCPPGQLDTEASERGFGSGARAVEAAKRLMPGFLNEQNERKEAARGAR